MSKKMGRGHDNDDGNELGPRAQREDTLVRIAIGIHRIGWSRRMEAPLRCG